MKSVGDERTYHYVREGEDHGAGEISTDYEQRNPVVVHAAPTYDRWRGALEHGRKRHTGPS